LYTIERIHIWTAIIRNSRSVFKNYLTVLSKYAVYKRLDPRKPIRVKCVAGGERELSAGEIHRLLLGLRTGSVVEYYCEDNTVELCNGSRVLLAEMFKTDPEAPLHGWKYNSKGFWELNGVKMKHVTTTVIEVFNKRYYDLLKHVEGRDAVDIGAGVGDSTVYLALRGARRVIALEPEETYYAELVENIELNGVKDRVIALNEYAGSHTLAEITTKYGVEDGVLKMDCEGCEHAVLDGAPNSVLERFKEIVIEYHGSPSPLVKKLADAGFRATVMPPWTVMNGLPIGFIRAER
jgi:hypothetical protein